MNPYLSYVERIQQGVRQARELRVDAVKVPPSTADRKVVIFSPHPDDECIIGALPLRLMREAGLRIINVPVTYGSNKERQAARAEELDAACGYLGWECIRGQDDLETLDVAAVVRLLEDLTPEIIFVPHVEDWNSRHISTHHLVVEALEKMGPDFTCTVVENEFWGAMDDPNLMIEADAATLADLVAATSLHAGEVARNPYHLLLPAWMQDNVRRGGELVGGQGRAAPDFFFATLYRLRVWRDGGFQKVLDQGINIPAGQLQETFPWKS